MPKTTKRQITAYIEGAVVNEVNEYRSAMSVEGHTFSRNAAVEMLIRRGLRDWKKEVAK